MESSIVVQNLEVISVNIWQIVISLINLLIMFLILKKFLFKPVKKMMDERRKQVDKIYDDAQKDKEAASDLKNQYEEHMSNARAEADAIVRRATETANARGESIIAEATGTAAHLKQKAEEEIALEKRRMLNEVRGEISELAVDIASKVVEKEIDRKAYDSFVDDFIQNVGEA